MSTAGYANLNWERKNVTIVSSNPGTADLELMKMRLASVGT
jgi:hypothetical protein